MLDRSWWAVISLALVGLSVNGMRDSAQAKPIPPPVVSQATENLEALIEEQWPFLELLPNATTDKSLGEPRFAGCWLNSGPLSHDVLLIEGEAPGPYEVQFETQGCTGAWSLRRKANYRDGMLELDRPVHTFQGSTYRRLVVTTVGGRVTLVPAERDRRSVAIWPASRWGGSSRRYLDGYQRRQKCPPSALLDYGVPAPSRDEPETTPAELVPQNHWAYDYVTMLAQRGFATGFPDNTFSGKRALTRGQFARGVRNLAASVAPLRQVGTAASHNEAMAMQRLLDTFRPDLLRDGADLSVLRQVWSDIEDAVHLRRPTGLAYPLPSGARRQELELARSAQSAGFRAGVARAISEWQQGLVLLQALDPVPASDDPLPRAIPLLRVPDGPGAAERVIGHNTEVWRRLRELGPPAGTSVSWLGEVFDLERAWKRSKPGQRQKFVADLVREARLDHDSGVLVREGRGRHWMNLNPTRLWARTPAGGVELEAPPGLRLGWAHLEKLEALWGPPGSGVVCLRGRIEGRKRIYAYDIRTGWLLNAAEG